MFMAKWVVQLKVNVIVKNNYKLREYFWDMESLLFLCPIVFEPHIPLKVPFFFFGYK